MPCPLASDERTAASICRDPLTSGASRLAVIRGTSVSAAGGKSHSWLLELSRRTGKEEHGREEHGVGEILAGAIARFARLSDPPGCVGSGCRRFRRATDLVKLRHKRVRVGGAILEWLLREPGVVGLLHVGRKTLGIKACELFVTGVLRGEKLHEHRSMDDQRLAALHIEHRGAPLQRI